mmetsp:Transcript_8703/g.25066  ORF Transcript_8703/g.25066 Transcript_8703/m.25066 type:complete len:231 (-) Transcript_8703:1292-1984(-)
MSVAAALRAASRGSTFVLRRLKARSAAPRRLAIGAVCAPLTRVPRKWLVEACRSASAASTTACCPDRQQPAVGSADKAVRIRRETAARILFATSSLRFKDGLHVQEHNAFQKAVLSVPTTPAPRQWRAFNDRVSALGCSALLDSLTEESFRVPDIEHANGTLPEAVGDFALCVGICCRADFLSVLGIGLARAKVPAHSKAKMQKVQVSGHQPLPGQPIPADLAACHAATL